MKNRVLLCVMKSLYNVVYKIIEFQNWFGRILEVSVLRANLALQISQEI